LQHPSGFFSVHHFEIFATTAIFESGPALPLPKWLPHSSPLDVDVHLCLPERADPPVYFLLCRVVARNHTRQVHWCVDFLSTFEFSSSKHGNHSHPLLAMLRPASSQSRICTPSSLIAHTHALIVLPDTHRLNCVSPAAAEESGRGASEQRHHSGHSNQQAFDRRFDAQAAVLARDVDTCAVKLKHDVMVCHPEHSHLRA
jgi:hypothetical protein